MDAQSLVLMERIGIIVYIAKTGFIPEPRRLLGIAATFLPSTCSRSQILEAQETSTVTSLHQRRRQASPEFGNADGLIRKTNA